MAAVLKTAGRKPREFESHPLRQRLARHSSHPHTPPPGHGLPVVRPRTVADMRGRRSVTGVLALVAIMAAVGLGGWAVLRHGTGCALAGDRPCLRVLFIGNSYTYVNELPEVFASLVRSGGDPVEVRMVAVGGAFLDQLATSPDTDAAMAAGPWTDVILQEQSQAPASGQVLRERTIPGAAALVDAIRATGGRPHLLETWAHRDGWPDLGMDYAAMQAALRDGYAAAAAATQSDVIPAGDAWQRATGLAIGVPLWQDDGSHPAVAGTYLVACVLYAELVGRSPVGLGETAGLDAVTAAQLQAVAAQVP